MNMAGRIKNLEAAHDPANHDLTLLTDGDLDALIACYDEQGAVITDRITPELEAALLRAKQ
jgi:phosphomannomutase